MAPPSKGALLRAEESIQATLAAADRVVTLTDGPGHAAHHELLSVLEAADVEVAKRLLKITPKANGELRFSAAQAISTRTQIQIVVERTKHKLGGPITDAAHAAMDASLKSGVKILGKLEQEFKGATVSPNILAAMQQSHVLHGPKASLVTRVATSLDRYGLEMGQQFARIIQVGLVSGSTNDQMLANLIAHGGPKGIVSLAAKEVAPGQVQRIREGHFPDGLFTAQKYWAERIVRTEVAHAFNSAKLEQLRQMRADGLNVIKKICAHFDTRTAPDSVYVHGQVRGLDESFLDGAGRVYLFPPGRPNDRETILPWFDDWAEVPSTKPPNPDELVQAEELAKPGPKGAPLVPRSTEELHRLESEARTAVELERMRQEGRAAQELTNADDDVKHADTQAAAVLARIEKATQQKQLALQKLAEEQVASAAKATAKKEQKELAKVDKTVHKQVLAGEAHLAHLDLIELSASKPDVFAKYANQLKDQPLPHESIVGGVKVSSAVLEAVVKDTLAGYDHLAKGNPTSGALDAFKASDKLEPYVKALLKDGTLKAKKKINALYVSEGQVTWDAALKKTAAKKASDLLKKYGPKTPAPAPAAPKPAQEAYTLKPSGPGFVDVFITNAQGDEQKIAYFTKDGSKYAVSPPPLLKGWSAKTFDTEHGAAEYALQVGQAIHALPIAAATPAPYVPPKPVYKGKVSRFNHDPAREIKSVLGPIALESKAAADIKRLRKIAAAKFKDGVKVLGDDTIGKGQVDELLKEHGLDRQQERWSDGIGGCWYTSSAGPKALAGKIIAHDDKKTAEHAVKMAEQVDGAPQDGPKYHDYARLKYAATQEALKRRMELGTLQQPADPNNAKSGGFKDAVDADGYVTLYRGIHGAIADKARVAREKGESVEIAFRSVSSWSTKRSAARRFSHADGIIVSARVHVSRIFSQYQQESIAMRRFGHTESEWIVICESKSESFTVHGHNVENPDDE